MPCLQDLQLGFVPAIAVNPITHQGAHAEAHSAVRFSGERVVVFVNTRLVDKGHPRSQDALLWNESCATKKKRDRFRKISKKIENNYMKCQIDDMHARIRQLQTFSYSPGYS